MLNLCLSAQQRPEYPTKTACNDTVEYVNKLPMDRIGPIGMTVTNEKQNRNQPVLCFSLE